MAGLDDLRVNSNRSNSITMLSAATFSKQDMTNTRGSTSRRTETVLENNKPCAIARKAFVPDAPTDADPPHPSLPWEDRTLLAFCRHRDAHGRLSQRVPLLPLALVYIVHLHYLQRHLIHSDPSDHHDPLAQSGHGHPGAGRGHGGQRGPLVSLGGIDLETIHGDPVVIAAPDGKDLPASFHQGGVDPAAGERGEGFPLEVFGIRQLHGGR